MLRYLCFEFPLGNASEFEKELLRGGGVFGSVLNIGFGFYRAVPPGLRQISSDKLTGTPILVRLPNDRVNHK